MTGTYDTPEHRHSIRTLTEYRSRYTTLDKTGPNPTTHDHPATPPDTLKSITSRNDPNPSAHTTSPPPAQTPRNHPHDTGHETPGHRATGGGSR